MINDTWTILNGKTELLSRLNTWSTESHYPYGTVYSYLLSLQKRTKVFRQGNVKMPALVAVEEIVYVFGGFLQTPEHTGRSVKIASFNTATKQWKKIGSTVWAEFGASVLVHDGAFIVAGGLDFYSIQSYTTVETCILDQNQIDCKQTGNSIMISRWDHGYLGMMHVPDYYCQ